MASFNHNDGAKVVTTTFAQPAGSEMHGSVLVNPVHGTGWLIGNDNVEIVIFDGDRSFVPVEHDGMNGRIDAVAPLTGWFATCAPFDGWYRQWLFHDDRDTLIKLVQDQAEGA